MKKFFIILFFLFVYISTFFIHSSAQSLPIEPPQGLVETTSCPITSAGNSTVAEPGDLGRSSLFLHSIWTRKNSEAVEDIINDLSVAKDKLETSSAAKSISKKITALTGKLTDALNKKDEKCNHALLLVSQQLERIIPQIQRLGCNEQNRTKKKKCIPSSVTDETISVIQNAKDKLVDLLSSDENGDQIADICKASDSSGNPQNNVGNIPPLEGAVAKPIPNRFIILLEDSVFDIRKLAQEFEQKFQLEMRHIFVGNFPGINIVAPEGVDVAELLKDTPNIKEVLHDYAFQIDDYNLPSEDVQARVKYQVPYIDVQTIPSNIKWIEADKNPNEGDMCKVTVAVIDSGIDYDHPDLRNNINKELSVNCIIKDPLGNCFPEGGEDDLGHGTNVAGIIAAEDNRVGSLGVGSKIELISVKVADLNGNVVLGDLIAGLNYVGGLSSEIEIANASVGGTFGKTPTQEEQDILKIINDALYRGINGGVIFVVAAGNDRLDVTENNSFPANNPSVITVSAITDRNGIHNDGDEAWAFWGLNPVTMTEKGSNFGLEVDIVAPGTLIDSTNLGGGYSTQSGTSFAAPHVAGTIGLFIAKNGRPQSTDKNFLRPMFKAITKNGKLRRDSPYPNEPDDGFLEPAVYANGPLLQP